MATLYSGYKGVRGIRWNYGGTYRLSVPPQGLRGTTVAWDLIYGGTYQVQYRVQSRLSLAAASTRGVAPAARWGEWGEWIDPEDAVQGDVKSTTQTQGDKVLWTGHPFTYAYDFSEYDMHAVQVRVRVIDEPSLTVSEWSYGDLRVVYRPEAVATASLQADGSALIHVSSNWGNGGGSLYIGDTKYCRDNVRGQSLGPYWNLLPWWPGGTYRTYLSDGDLCADATAPAGAIQRGHLYMETLQLVTGDGAQAVWPDNVYQLDCAADEYRTSGRTPSKTIYDIPVAEHPEPTTIDTPQIATSQTDDGDLLITVSGGTWDGVQACCKWTDARGVTRSEVVTMSQSGSSWTGTLVAPPYDVPVSVTVAGVVGGDFRTSAETVTADSDGAVELRHVGGAELIRLRYDVRDTVQRMFKPEMDTFKPAGSPRPKSRYGEGGAMSIGLSGTVVEAGYTDGYLDEAGLATLVQAEVPGDWLLRIPGGERYTVAISSLSVSNAPAAGFYEASFDCEVVS